MNKKTFTALWLLALALIVLMACNFPGVIKQAIPTDSLQTLAAQTVAAQMTQFDLELTQAPTKLPETATPLPTSTLQPPTETPLPTNTSRPPATATAVPCNWAQFVKDVTIPDETGLTAGESFTKVWRLRNIGGCTWSKDYALFFSSGDKMDGATLVPLPHAVLPGKKIDLEVQLVAPDKAGEYLGNWMLRSSSGEVFGIGTEGSKPFWVQIKVKDQKTIWENYQNP